MDLAAVDGVRACRSDLAIRNICEGAGGAQDIGEVDHRAVGCGADGQISRGRVLLQKTDGPILDASAQVGNVLVGRCQGASDVVVGHAPDGVGRWRIVACVRIEAGAPAQGIGEVIAGAAQLSQVDGVRIHRAAFDIDDLPFRANVANRYGTEERSVGRP